MKRDTLISATNVSVHYPISGGKLLGPKPVVRAVENVTLNITKGSFFGLVGESGSGKTTLGRAMLKAAPITSGVVNFNDGYFGADAPKTKEELQKYNSLKNKVHKALDKKFPKLYFEK